MVITLMPTETVDVTVATIHDGLAVIPHPSSDRELDHPPHAIARDDRAIYVVIHDVDGLAALTRDLIAKDDSDTVVIDHISFVMIGVVDRASETPVVPTEPAADVQWCVCTIG